MKPFPANLTPEQIQEIIEWCAHMRQDSIGLSPDFDHNTVYVGSGAILRGTQDDLIIIGVAMSGHTVIPEAMLREWERLSLPILKGLMSEAQAPKPHA